MYYYKVSAEHVSRIDVGKAADEMEKIPGVMIMTAGMDDLFERNGLWVVASEEMLGNQLQDIVWRYNGGAWCAQFKIDEEIADSYC
jgi:hypothetical protein